MLANTNNCAILNFKKYMFIYSMYIFTAQILYVDQIFSVLAYKFFFILFLLSNICIASIWMKYERSIFYFLFSLSWVLNIFLNPDINTVTMPLIPIVSLILGFYLHFDSLKEDSEFIFSLILILISCTYFIAGAGKIYSDFWRSGDAVRHLLNNFEGRFEFLARISNKQILIGKVLTWATIFTEIIFSVLILFKKYRVFSLNILILFHISILCSLKLFELTIPILIILNTLKIFFKINDAKPA